MPARRQLNATHDPACRSWVASANAADSDFPLQNLPFGVFTASGRPARGGVAIGDQIVDLAEALAAGLFEGAAAQAAWAASGPCLNPLLTLGPVAASALRARLFELLQKDAPDADALQSMTAGLLVPMAEAELKLPVRVTQFTDMCASTFHISRCRGEGEHDPPVVPPVLERLPVGYNGRASSVIVSGTRVHRPSGQWKRSADAVQIDVGPEPWLDYELEMGMWVAGPANRLGEPIAIADAANRMFGFCLLNDWSARGIQMFESMLGPFLGKSFATTVSPWIVTSEALEPYRVAASQRIAGKNATAAYLSDAYDRESGGYHIEMDASVRSEAMRERGDAPMRLSRTNFRHLYWTWAQMLAHHASNGCNLDAGDLIGSGTCSGPTVESAGCLLELTQRSRRHWHLPNGETRLYLESGDEVAFSARATAPGYVSLGFGACSGVIEN